MANRALEPVIDGSNDAVNGVPMPNGAQINMGGGSAEVYPDGNGGYVNASGQPVDGGGNPITPSNDTSGEPTMASINANRPVSPAVATPPPSTASPWASVVNNQSLPLPLAPPQSTGAWNNAPTTPPPSSFTNTYGVQPSQPPVNPMSLVAQMQAPTGNAFTGAYGQVSDVLTPSMNDAVSAYGKQLQTSLNPQFDDQFNQLKAREAAMGILDSGGARQDFQDLTGRNNATFAASMMPLIQQGYGQQFSAAVDNASARNTQLGQLQSEMFQGNTDVLNRQEQAAQANQSADNAYLSQLTGIGASNTQANADRALRASEFNTGTNQNYDFKNMDAKNALLLAQLGYANQGYQNATGTYGSMLQSGANNVAGVYGTGQNAMFQGYTSPQTANQPYASQYGNAAGYGSAGSGGAGGVDANGYPLPKYGTGGNSQADQNGGGGTNSSGSVTDGSDLNPWSDPNYGGDPNAGGTYGYPIGAPSV